MIESIDDLNDSRLDSYRDLISSKKAKRDGRFIVEGFWPVERLIASEHPVESILCEKNHTAKLRALCPDTKIYQVPDGAATELVGFSFHRGVLGCGIRPNNFIEFSEVFDLTDHSKELQIVVCSQINDGENLGGILRSCAAFGVDLVLLDRCTDPYSRRTTRVSMANNLFLPIFEPRQFATALQRLKSEKIELIAAAIGEYARDLSAVEITKRAALIFGSEGYGLDKEIIDLADQSCMIPMSAEIDSLNVSVAAGIFMYRLFG